ncbi:MAG: response regulator transcription factor [Myxococcales bacterium]|nr:response regulator transcription factor [Myxococcales bacterium]
MKSPRIRVLLADDHQIVREGLRSLLRAEADMEIVGEAEDGAEVVRLAEAGCPDVVLMDIGMRGLNGVEATRRLKKTRPAIQVVILSMYDDPATVDRALKAGARGYVVKGRGIESLVEAIRFVSRGEVYLSPDISQHLLRGYLQPGAGEVDPLSPREREILELIAEAFNGPQIAERLGLSPKTVENHRARIMEKLGIHNTAGLVRYALQIGLAK